MKIMDLSIRPPTNSWILEKNWEAIVRVLQASQKVLKSIPNQSENSFPYPFTQAHQELLNAINQLEEIV